MIPATQDKEDTILALRKVFHISNISNLGAFMTAGAFRVARNAQVDPIVMGAWLRLCQVLGERNTRVIPQFDVNNIENLSRAAAGGARVRSCPALDFGGAYHG